MINSESFESNKLFTDYSHFPYGFSRSGEFTSKQSVLLERHGHAYMQLQNGERTPITEEEQSFVLFCENKKAAITVHEKTWQIYKAYLAKRNTFISMAAITPKQSSYEPSDSYDEDIGAEA